MNMGITGIVSFTILTVRECRHTPGGYFFGGGMYGRHKMDQNYNGYF